MGHHQRTMPGNAPFLRPEEQHLLEQERLVAELTEQLVTKETDFATTGATFARFRVAYLQRFAPLYAELDRLEAEIARQVAAKQRTKAAKQRAADAAAQAKETTQAAEQIGEAGKAIPLDGNGAQAAPSEDLRSLYKQAARTFHPDLAADDEERARRTALMAAVNAAYDIHDAAALKRLLDGELARPEAVKGDDLVSRLIRAIRRLAQIRGRFTELVELTEALEADPLFRLFSDARDAWEAGADPLAEDEAHLRSQLSSAKAQLAALDLKAKRPPQPSP